MSNLHYKTELSTKQLAMVENEMESRQKSPVVTWLLWFITGGFAGHRFYLGDTGYAVCMLLFGWLTLFIWPLVDAFFIQKALKKKNEAIELEVIQRVKTLVKE